MHNKFRIEEFQPVKLEEAQKILEKHLNDAKETLEVIENHQKALSKKSLWDKMTGWFKEHIMS